MLQCVHCLPTGAPGGDGGYAGDLIADRAEVPGLTLVGPHQANPGHGHDIRCYKRCEYEHEYLRGLEPELTADRHQAEQCIEPDALSVEPEDK